MKQIEIMLLHPPHFGEWKTEYIPGKVCGFLTAPNAAEKPFTASKAEILDTVSDLDLSRFLPDKVLIGEQYAGPADLLSAMLGILGGSESAEITPKEQLVSVDLLGELKDFQPAGTWHRSLEVTDRYVSDRLRLQNRTLSYPKTE